MVAFLLANMEPEGKEKNETEVTDEEQNDVIIKSIVDDPEQPHLCISDHGGGASLVLEVLQKNPYFEGNISLVEANDRQDELVP